MSMLDLALYYRDSMVIGFRSPRPGRSRPLGGATHPCCKQKNRPANGQAVFSGKRKCFRCVMEALALV